MHVDAADDVVSSHGLNDVVIRDGHPLPSGDAALQLAARHAREFFVPAGLQSDPVFVAVDADGSAGQVAERLAALLDAREREAALEPAATDEGQLDQLLLLDVRDAASDEGVAAAHVASVAQNFAVFSGAFVAQHVAESGAQVVEFAVKGVPIDGFAFAVPPHFKNGHRSRQDTSIGCVDLSARRSDGLDARFEALAHSVPLLVFRALDPQDASKNGQSQCDEQTE